MKSKLLLFALTSVALFNKPIFGQYSVHVIPCQSISSCDGRIENNNIFAQEPFIWRKKNSNGIYEIITDDFLLDHACVGNYSFEYQLSGGQSIIEYFFVPWYENSHPCFFLTDVLEYFEVVSHVRLSETPVGIVGRADLTQYSGNPPTTYNWSNGHQGPLLINQPSGNYTCIIEDGLGCKKVISVTIPYFLPPTNTSSCDGIAYIDSLNMGGAYWYNSVDNNYLSNSFTLDDICDETLEDFDLFVINSFNEFGNYTSCAFSYPEMTDCNSFHAEPTTEYTYNGECVGMAAAFVPSSPDELSYQWSNGETTPFITGLCEGNYSCIVSDNNGCSDTIELTILSHAPIIPYDVDTFFFEFNNNIGPGVNPSVVLDLQAIEDCSFDPNLFGSASITLIENTASGSLITWTIYAIDGAVLDSYQLEYPVTLLPGTTYSAPFILYCDGRSDGTFAISLIEFFETDLSLNLLDLSDQWIHLTNPINQELQVSFSKLFAGNLRLFDSSGKLIFSETFNGTEYTRTTSELATGIYILELESGNQIKRMKLVK